MRYNKRRSVVLLWFCLVSLPLAFFAGVISIEYQRMLVANRTANSLAESAATAASLKLVVNDPECPECSSDRIDASEGPKAMQRVLDAYAASMAAREAASVINVTGSSYIIKDSTVTPAYPSYIKVEIPYTVTPAGFLSVARMMLGDTSATPFSGIGRGFAYVCVPGAGLTANGECAKPR